MINASKTKLNTLCHHQKDIYDMLKDKFLSVFNSVNKDSDHIIPFWKNINDSLLKKFTPYPPFNFLDTKEIAETMYSFDEMGAKAQLQYLESLYSEALLTLLLQEELVGNPLILNDKYLASCNSIHHLYHYQRYLNKIKDSDVKTIVEFGGGYGHFVILSGSLNSKIRTYVIIDTPLMISLQWLYLSCSLGTIHINVIENDQLAHIQYGKINLLPIHRLEEIKDIDVDLFIALWSLSEASDKTQEFMEKTNFMNAKHLLMAFHSNQDTTLPNGNRLYNFTKDRYILEPTGNVNNHFYCFK